jgi:hypothetical protein
MRWVISLLAVFLLTGAVSKRNGVTLQVGGAVSDPAIVDFAASAGAGNDSTQTISQTIGSGNCVVVCVAWEDADRAPSVADTLSNTYDSIVEYSTGGNQFVAWFVAKNCNAGATTITATYGASTAYVHAVAWEISGASITTPADDYDTGTGTSTDALTAAITTTSANTVLLSVVHNYTARACAPLANWTEDLDIGTTRDAAYYSRKVTSTGNYQGGGTLAVSATWLTSVIAIK